MNPPTFVFLSTNITAIRVVAQALRGLARTVCARDETGMLARLASAEEERIEGVIVDHASTAGSAVRILSAVRSANARLKRVLLTDHCDLSIVVEGLSTGAIQQVVYNPLYPPELFAALGLAAAGVISLPTKRADPFIAAKRQ